ncbi:MAG: hypothetical protein IJQ08_04775 [Synergistaceae bacterium]|nr:hypothetical protein [Synergistaceae bacterium]
MKRKILTVLFILGIAVLALNASRGNDELKRMGIFLSNFTELGMYDIDIDTVEDADLIRFGIGHNVINNPKSTLKRCNLRDCEYGSSLMSGAAVAASVRKYFDLEVRHKNVLGHSPEAGYDGDNYHFNARDWHEDTVYYAEVQNVRQGRGFVQMDGELYNIKRKSDRPAYFVAKAKPYRYNGKNTWAILSLTTEWK